jgi:hypothetical protein
MKSWDVKKTQYRVSDFVSWQKAKALELSPNFQRRSVWRPDAKSFLIDTLVRGLPIPIIILRERRTDLTTLEPKREVVDGQQRIRTILTYISPSLLKDYKPSRDDFAVKSDHNDEIAGMTFQDLQPEVKQRILDYEFSVHILPASTDDREVLQIFARLNATGYKLTPQELRNAEFFGAFKTSMYQLASEQLYRWRDWKIFTEYNITRMEEVELTSEFTLLMLRKRIVGKTQESLDRIYKEKDTNYPERTEVERRLRVVMDTIEDRLGNELKTLPFKRKTLFYSLFAFFYDLQFGIDCALDKKVRPRPITPEMVAVIKLGGDRIQRKEAPLEVLEAVERRTTHPSSRQTIINYLHCIGKNG